MNAIARSCNQSYLKLSWRIGLPLYEKDKAFSALLKFLKRHRKIVDEVAFFETITHHLYLPPAVMQKRAGLLKRRMAAMKDAGIPSVGINILTTLGHLNEAWDFVSPLPFQRTVGHNGIVSKGCACPNTPGLQKYVRQKYTLFAKAEPDFIWIDDDFRMGNHGFGVVYGCFCPTCLRLFSVSAGSQFSTRQKLIAALNKPANKKLREAWLEHNIRTLESLGRDVVAAIHAVSPDIKTGLMIGGSFYNYNGAAYIRFCAALKAEKFRPGGGYYSDNCPNAGYAKAIDTARQCDGFPPAISELQYELENFPYQTLNKSRASLVNECTLALAFGLNGIAFNALHSIGDNALCVREKLMSDVFRARPFWEEIVARANGLPGHGLWMAWHRGMLGQVELRDGKPWLDTDWSWNMKGAEVELGRLGLPLSAHRPGICTILAGHAAETFTEDDLRKMLSGAVLMDSSTLEILERRGLGKLTGVRIARRWDNGVMERLTDDPLNRPWTGSARDARIEFWGNALGLGDMLEPLHPEVKVLSRLETYFGRMLGPCVTAFENRLGGRVIVTGYAQWMFLGSEAKRSQLQNVLDWATRGKLAVRIDETVPLVPVARLSPEKDRGVIVLINSGFDIIEKATLRFRGPPTRVRLAAPGMQPLRLDPVREINGWRIALKDFAPWRVKALLLGDD